MENRESKPKQYIALKLKDNKNPMRTIPILDEGEFTLADSHAIALYLITKYGKPEHSYLYPDDIRTRARIHQIMFIGVLFPRLRAVMAPTYSGKLGELSNRMIVNIVDAYTMLEEYLASSSFLTGNSMTVADLSVLTTVSSLNGLHPIDGRKFPKLTKWLNTMNDMDVCRRINAPGSELHVMGLKALMTNYKSNQKSKL
ncbi:glutathione S-transferase 1 [Amyelois transitella]|uniref:glutathione S-transferase 1 n=1 Tax=Amyelois transitella TaxID=680683 RepID=UPI00067C7102|nr:glutathione S-transferase 1 [Amyelois transitella]